METRKHLRLKLKEDTVSCVSKRCSEVLQTDLPRRRKKQAIHVFVGARGRCPKHLKKQLKSKETWDLPSSKSNSIHGTLSTCRFTQSASLITVLDGDKDTKSTLVKVKQEPANEEENCGEVSEEIKPIPLLTVKQELGDEGNRDDDHNKVVDSSGNDQGTSSSGTVEWNVLYCDAFLVQLRAAVAAVGHAPSRLFAVAPLSLCTAQARGPARTTRHRHRRRVSAVACASAAGAAAPPLLVLPSAAAAARLEPPGATAWAQHRSGLPRARHFARWLRHFAAWARSSPRQPAALLADARLPLPPGACDAAARRGVTLLRLPPRARPLHRGFARRLKRRFADGVKSWLLGHPGQLAPLAELARIMAEACSGALTTNVAIEGFRKAGLLPIGSGALWRQTEETPAQRQRIKTEEQAERTEVDVP